MAKEGYLFAEAKANEWHLEAVPAHVDNVGEVDGKGKAAAWAVRQPAKHTGSSERKAPLDFGPAVFPVLLCKGLGSVSDWKVDSPETACIAEENGGMDCRSEG